MVAFGLRMLNAEVPFYLNRGDESISNLLKLIKLVNKVIGELKTDEGKSDSKLAACKLFICSISQEAVEREET